MPPVPRPNVPFWRSMPPVPPRRRPREEYAVGMDPRGTRIRRWGPSSPSPWREIASRPETHIPVPLQPIIDLIDTFNARLDSLDVASDDVLSKTADWSDEARKQDKRRKEALDPTQQQERIDYANGVVGEMNEMSRYYEQLMRDLHIIESHHLYLSIQTGPYIQIFIHNNQLVRSNINERLKSLGKWLTQTQFKGLTDTWQIPDRYLVDFNFNRPILLPGPPLDWPPPE